MGRRQDVYAGDYERCLTDVLATLRNRERLGILPPTRLELALNLQISLAKATRVLEDLRNRGDVTWEPGQTRGVRVLYPGQGRGYGLE